MTTEFDPHKIIRKLAAAEWTCPCVYSGTLCTACELRNEENPNQEWDECPRDCYSCNGTGRIVPFARLRVPHCTKTVRHWHRTVFYDPTKGKPCSEGWLSEPNVEAACWRIHVWARTSGYWDEFAEWVSYFVVVDKLDLTQSYLRAAEAWLEEKMKEAS